MFTGQKPAVMSACIGEQHQQVIKHWIADLQEAVATVKSNPGVKLEGNTAVYGAAAMAPDAALEDILRNYCDIKMMVATRAK